MSAFPIPLDIEESDISSSLNSVILFIFLMGMYTISYFGTLYLYFTKNPSKYHPVPAAITLLYLSGAGATALQWYAMKWQFIDNGATRDSVFVAVVNSPQWFFIGLDTFYCVTYVISDGLLIWRCFHVWNRSWCVIAPSLSLLFTEFVLFVVEISFEAKFSSSDIPLTLAATLNIVLAAVFFISAGTTLITTVLIAYKVFSVGREAGTYDKRFKHIVDIVVQSGAVYALSQFAAALGCVVPGAITFNKSVIALQDYAQVLNFAIAVCGFSVDRFWMVQLMKEKGLSTTVMVARVAVYSPDTACYPSTSRVSGLRFRVRSTRQTDNVEGVVTTDSANSDRILANERKTVKEQV